MEVYFIRHTAPDIEKGICYGQADIDLKDSFETEVKNLCATIPGEFDMVFSSPLSRCQQLAGKLPCKKSIVIDQRIMEINFGSWELKPWDDIPKQELNLWMQDFVNVRPPGGESMSQLQKRVLDWWKDLQLSSDQKIAVVTHGGVIRTFWAYHHQKPLKNAFKDFDISYGEVCSFQIK